jgi:hypothetical protein
MRSVAKNCFQAVLSRRQKKLQESPEAHEVV